MRFFLINILLTTFLTSVTSARNDAHIKQLLSKRRFHSDPENVVLSFIQRIIGDKHDISDFIIKFNNSLNSEALDTFQLQMDPSGQKLIITANSVIAATWGFNYYLKYYTNSSVFWSGKNIALTSASLPYLEDTVTVTANDRFRYYQNVCTYSYSYVWWDWSRWEYEIDWMALNGINLVYAHTAAEYIWISVFEKMGFTRQEIDDFFPGPAFLAWFRMGNLKNFGGPLTDNWHADQVNLQKQILQRMDELGISYILPAFAGFVPDSITRIYPNKNFTISKDWNGLGCNYSCVYLVEPTDPLFQYIGNMYINETINVFGTGHFYSADVFNEMDPSSNDLDYLARVNEAVYNAMAAVDPSAVWVMQAWLFNSGFWTYERVQAFLSKVPIGRLILLDLFSEVLPHYQQFKSYFGHLFIWNMLHDFGGANGIFGQISAINSGADIARNFTNSSMVGIGITMEGINQNEVVYDFMLEKSWRHTLDNYSLAVWVDTYAKRRYFFGNFVSVMVREALLNITTSVQDNQVYDYYNRQTFTIRPSLDINVPQRGYIQELYDSWGWMVDQSFSLKPSQLFKYDLADVTKEVLRYKFDEQYVRMVNAYIQNDLYQFADAAGIMIEILNDTDLLLSSDSHFLLGNWIEDAKSKAKNEQELDNYELNARLQITLWGKNYSQSLFDYACKAWGGLIRGYYMPRWQIFFEIAEKSILEGKLIDNDELNEKLLTDAEIPFVTSKSVYPNYTMGDTFEIVQMIYNKYGI